MFNLLIINNYVLLNNVCLKYCLSSCYGNLYFFYNLGFDTDPTEKRHFGEYIPVR